MYEYKAIPFIGNVKTEDNIAVGNQLSVLMNQQASLGWEFYQINTVGISVNPGCLESLLSLFLPKNPYMGSYRHDMVIFRKELGFDTMKNSNPSSVANLTDSPNNSTSFINPQKKSNEDKDEIFILDNLTPAEEKIKNNLTVNQWREALVSSKKMGKTIAQWREIVDQLMHEHGIVYRSQRYCVRGLSYEYLNDAINSINLLKSTKVKNAKCPNCDSLVNLLDKECAKCSASFGDMSIYRPKPL